MYLRVFYLTFHSKNNISSRSFRTAQLILFLLNTMLGWNGFEKTIFLIM